MEQNRNNIYTAVATEPLGDAMKRFLVCVLGSVVLLSSPAFAEDETGYIYRLLQGFPENRGPAKVDGQADSDKSSPSPLSIGDIVPDEKTALAVVEVLVRSKYGEDIFEQNRPWTVRRDGDFWLVDGKEKKPFVASSVRISRIDGRIDAFLVFSDSDSHPLAMKFQNKYECGPACHKAPAK
jgi:hypothetical protein